MKKFFDWLIRNLSNIFGLLGILLTIYFGAVYAPDWIKEAKNEKIKNAQHDIQQSIKELVFSDSTVTIRELQSLMTAKEIELKQTLPFSLKEILILTQESFMEDKFLPLVKRRELNTEIEKLKDALPKTTEQKIQEAKSESKGSSLIQIIIAMLSIVTSIAGVFSFYIKYRTEKETMDEINNDIERMIVDVPYQESGRQTEQEFIKAFKEIKDIEFRIPDRDEGYDLVFIKDNKDYYVEFKFLTKSKVGVGSFKQFLYSVKDLPGEAWFIYNTDVTPLVLREAKEFNDTKSNISVKLIKMTSPTDILTRFDQLVRTNKK